MVGKCLVFEVEDIFTCILTEWLSFRDRLRLDRVLHGAKRTLYHTVQRRLPISPLASNRRQFIESAMFQWMALRQIYLTSGVWQLQWCLVQKFVGDPTHRPILQHMEGLEMHYVDQLDWHQCAVFQNLRSVSLLCQGHGVQREQSPRRQTQQQPRRQTQTQQPHTDTSDQPIFPKLEKLRLHNARLAADMLSVFAAADCERLVDVEYDCCAQLDPLRAADQATLWPYFQRMRSLRLAGNTGTGGILSSHFPQIERAELDELALVQCIRSPSARRFLSHGKLPALMPSADGPSAMEVSA